MSLSTFCSFALLGASAFAQQYAGETISGYMPETNGAEVAFFRISDPAGSGFATLVNYNSLGSDGQRLKPSNIQRAVIMMAGQRRDADQYITYVSTHLALYTENLYV